jgi:hypothetical protein
VSTLREIREHVLDEMGADWGGYDIDAIVAGLAKVYGPGGTRADKPILYSADAHNGSYNLTPRRTVRISDEVWQAAQKRAAERDESVSEVIREALVKYAKRKG